MIINELRIGNCVKCKISNDAMIYHVLSIDGYNMKVMLDGARQGEWQTEDRIKPISLTAEWLIKYGFHGFNTEGESLFCRDNAVEGHRFFIRHEKYFYYENVQWECKLEFVHQLQNLYHSLTGEELPITL